MGSQALPPNLLQHGPLSPRSRGPTRSLLQSRLPMGLQPPDIHLLWCVVIPGLQGSLHPCCPPLPAGTQLPHCGLCGLEENLCSCAWSNSFPSFFTDYSVCRAASLTYPDCSLLWSQFLLHYIFFPLLIYVIPETLLLMLTGLAKWWARLGASWHCFHWAWGKLLSVSHRSHLFSPPHPHY